MEYASTKPAKPSSNISEIISKFAKVCKLRSMGVFSSENPNPNHHPHNPGNDSAPLREDSSDNTDETDFVCEKVHPNPPPDVLSGGNVCGEVEISKLFEIVSALKSAYVLLQQAHIPYDPDKIEAADQVIVAQLEALCKIKRAYKEKQFRKPKLDSSRLACVRKEVKVNERLLQKLKSAKKAKDSEIVQLRQKLEDLELGNKKLVEKIRQESLERKTVMMALNVSAFEDAYKAASKSIHDFAKPLISLMKASGWDLDLAANSIEDAVSYSVRSSKKYAFEAYVARRMFHGMSFESFNMDAVMRLDDPIDALIQNPNSGFARFCGQKYLLVVHPLMEASFFGNLDQRAFVSIGKHPRTPFYHIFAKMARGIWFLQAIAASMDPKPNMFVVKRGSKFSGVYMESIQDGNGTAVLDKEQTSCNVEFMVMPGFRIGEALVRSRVFVSET